VEPVPGGSAPVPGCRCSHRTRTGRSTRPPSTGARWGQVDW
jgi:hypothetical protein